MKIFLVDIHNALDMSHYETFFYKNIKEGNIKVFEKSPDSMDRLDSVFVWITEEINRNPFSIDQALVIFFLPRKLSADRIPRDFEIYSKMCVFELLMKRLDQRFKFLCIYLDETGKDEKDDNIYKIIDGVNEDFSTDDEILRESFMPRSVPNGDEKVKAKVETREIIEKISESDPVAGSFYDGVWSLLDKTELEEYKCETKNISWYKDMFLRQCRESVSAIKTFRCSYSSVEITYKIKTELKIVKYVCAFADDYDPEKDFDAQFSEFLKEETYDGFNVDLEAIQKVLSTYKARLESWKPVDTRKKEACEPFAFESGDHSSELEEKVKAVSLDDLKSTLNPADEDLADYDLQDKVFSSLDDLIKDVNTVLREFCDERVSDMRDFFNKSTPTLTERSQEMPLSEEELKDERVLAEQMNQYITTELPGYPAELKLRQELELLGKKIRRIGRLMKSMKPLAFLFTLLFALASIGIYYCILQNSVFNREKTWHIFGIYIGVSALLFFLSYYFVRSYYKKKIRKYLNQCFELVNDYLSDFISKAKEFESNMNSALDYYCKVDENNKKIRARLEDAEYEKRKQWHRLKINSILNNISFFDAFLGDTKPQNENGVPDLNLFEDDAAHSEFYQMKIFN